MKNLFSLSWFFYFIGQLTDRNHHIFCYDMKVPTKGFVSWWYSKLCPIRTFFSVMFDPDIMLPRFIINNDVVSENYKNYDNGGC